MSVMILWPNPRRSQGEIGIEDADRDHQQINLAPFKESDYDQAMTTLLHNHFITVVACLTRTPRDARADLFGPDERA